MTRPQAFASFDGRLQLLLDAITLSANSLKRESHLKNIEDHFVRGVWGGLRRVVEDRLEEVVVEVRRHDRRRVLFAVEQKQQLK